MKTSLVTEKEATGDNSSRGKRCPELSNGHAQLDCVGSRCMAWRWCEEMRLVPVDTLNLNTTGWEKQGEPTKFLMFKKTEVERQAWTRDVGYCGKFGKPEE